MSKDNERVFVQLAEQLLTTLLDQQPDERAAQAAFDDAETGHARPVHPNHQRVLTVAKALQTAYRQGMLVGLDVAAAGLTLAEAVPPVALHDHPSPREAMQAAGWEPKR